MIDRVDLIICRAILVANTLRPQLISDDFRAVPMASRNQLCFASLLGAILMVFGGQNGRRNRCWSPFFSMSFLHTSLYRFRFDFLKIRTLKIEPPPRREHDFCKIDVDKKNSKKRRFGLHFRMPKRMKFQVKLIPQTCFFSTSILLHFVSVLVSILASKNR